MCIRDRLSGIELLKQSINLFGFEIRPLLSRALQQSIFPVVMARLLLCFAKTGLFSEAVSASVAKANFEKLISVSPVWVNHQVLDHIFERRMFNEFSQDLFDNLIVASKNLHDLKSYFRVLLSDKDSSSSPRVRNQQSAFVGRFFATNQELTFEESHMEQDAPSFPQP